MIGCLVGQGQVRTGEYYVYNDSSVRVRLDLLENQRFEYFDIRGSSCYSWGMGYGDYKVQNDTLFLYYKRLQQRANNDTNYLPVQYTMYDGTVVIVTNSFIVTEIKKYRIDNSVLYVIKDDKDNQATNWGNFDFVFHK